MSNLVIVAIPEEQDRTWKISSEQVPHLTLLFLGDEANADTQQIVQFVEHAVTMSEHGQFYLDVERRGTLGPDDADVLFFSKRSWNLKWIRQFRGQLLQNQAVRTAYDSTEQYENWLPHLTLGYPPPGEPAKPLSSDDYPIYSVCFDRIAVWTTDFDGPEFQLEWPERELEGPLAVAYSDTQKAALMHYGTKGMKWGVKAAARNVGFVSRRARNTEIAIDLGSKAVSKLRARSAKKTETVAVGGKTKQVTPKKAAKLDKKFDKEVHSVSGSVQVNNLAADHFNQRIGTLNDKYKNSDFSKDSLTNPSKEYKKYLDEARGLQKESLEHAVSKMSKSPTGKRKAKVEFDDEAGTWRLATTDVKHAESDLNLKVEEKFDSEGKLIGIKLVEDKNNMQQTATHGEAFVDGLVHGSLDPAEEFLLEHVGVKGMRWGHRKSPEAIVPVATSRVPAGTKRKTKIEVSGGENHPASEDAIRVAKAHAKLKKSGLAALSNQELQDVQTRLNLERNVGQLVSSKTRLKRGREFVKGLTRGGKEVNDAVNTGFQTARLAAQVR